MALREGTLTVRFTGGIETKQDPKAVPTSRLLAAENCIFARMGAAQKRLGYDSLGTAVLGSTTGYSNPRGLGARGDELILFTEGTSYSYVEGSAAWSQIPDGVQSVKQTDRAIVKTISNQTACDYAAASGIALVAWEDSRGAVCYAVLEADGGRVIVPTTRVGVDGSRPRCVRCDTHLVLLWAEATLGQLRSVVVDPAAPHAPSGEAIVTDDLVTTAANFDACPVGDNNDAAQAGACLAWNSTAGIRAGWLSKAGIIGTPGAGFPGPVTITPAATVTAGPVITAPTLNDSAEWFLAWAISSAVYVGYVSSDPTTPTVAIREDSVINGAAGGVEYLAIAVRDVTVDVWYENREAVVRNSSVGRLTVTSGVVTAGVPAAFLGACLASCGWSDTPAADMAQRSYVTLIHPTPLQSTYLTVRDDGLCVAQSIPGNAGDPPTTQRPRVVDTDGDRRYQWCAVYKGKLDALNNDVFTDAGPRLVTLDFDAADAYQTAYLGRTLYLSGAVTMAYDGVSWVEAGFHYAPDWEAGDVLHTASASGTGGMANGVYAYIFWYEATLANGEIIRGPTSKPYSVTVSGTDDQITLNVPALRLSAWGRSGGAREDEDVRVCAARTTDGDASIYYRVTSLDPSATGANGYVVNDQGADTVAIIDEYSDTTLALKEPHYTTGGIPSNDAIATAGVIAEGKGRLFCASSSDPSTVYFSHERADGYTVEMSPDLAIAVPPYGGAVTGLAVMDDGLLIFKRGAIYVVAGNGPLPGASVSEGWHAPRLITTDVGCIDQRTIATTPMGIVFQSAKGIYQLDRGGQVSYVGAPVEAYNAQTITRVTLIEDATQLRFLTSDGVTLLYDYLFGQWATWTQHEGLDAAVIGGAYHYLRADGRVFKQAETYLDDNLQIPMALETAWLAMREARQGFQRIWYLQILGTWKSAHTLRVQWKTDYDAAANWSAPIPIDATSMGGDSYGPGDYGDGVYGGDSPSPYEFTIHVGEVCESIQFRFELIEAYGAAGACAEFTELLVTGGMKSNTNKLPAERTG